MKTIAILGGKTFGLELSILYANKNFKVYFYSESHDFIIKGKEMLPRLIKYLFLRNRDYITQKNPISDQISFTSDIDFAVENADFVINIIDDVENKRKYNFLLGDICKKETIIITQLRKKLLNNIQ